MPEILLHYIWSKGLFLGLPQITTDGRSVEVISMGKHNLDQGPDFFGAVIRIGGVEWSGNVEIHVRASDWYKHGHQHDKAYDNIILHVVREADKPVFSTTGQLIAQCELQFPENSSYLAQMLADRSSLCAEQLFAHPELLQDNWKTTLLRDRMQKKTQAIETLLRQTCNAWEQAFYITLAHNFGFHTNGLPFELLAKHTPLACLQKHRDSLFQLEAILYGQSGLLTSETATDEYRQKLLTEYTFLRKKFSLTPIDGTMWKRMRMRPQNFPEVRIAQFAALIHHSEGLFAKIIQESDPQLLRSLFAIQASDYWRNAKIGKGAIDVLLINTVVPYKYAWGKQHAQPALQEEAYRILQQLPAEENHNITQWKLLGVEINNAADSQTFIHLYQDYCIRHRCLNCDIGYQIFTANDYKQ